MQLWLLTQRYYTYISALEHILETGAGVILDRSVYSDWVFAERNRLDGNIPEDGFQLYLSLRKKMLERLPAPQVMIYLDVSPEECYRRVHNLRQRTCEVSFHRSV
jgi:NADH dehydrogenase (ubiquinone) 1 alpha subcomplex subunit 10